MTNKEYEEIPYVIRDVLDSYSDDAPSTLDECCRIKRSLNELGWDCDYDFVGEVYNVIPLRKSRHINVSLGEDTEFIGNSTTIEFKNYSSMTKIFKEGTSWRFDMPGISLNGMNFSEVITSGPDVYVITSELKENLKNMDSCWAEKVELPF